MSKSAMTLYDRAMPEGYSLYFVTWCVDEDSTGDEGVEVPDPSIEDTVESYEYYHKWREHYGLPTIVLAPDLEDEDDYDGVVDWICDEYEWLLYDCSVIDADLIGTKGAL